MNAPFNTASTFALPAELDSLSPPPLLLLLSESLEKYELMRHAIFADLAPRSVIEWLSASRGATLIRVNPREPAVPPGGKMTAIRDHFAATVSTPFSVTLESVPAMTSSGQRAWNSKASRRRPCVAWPRARVIPQPGQGRPRISFRGQSTGPVVQ